MLLAEQLKFTFTIKKNKKSAEKHSNIITRL